MSLAEDPHAYGEALSRYLASAKDLDEWRGAHYDSTERKILHQSGYMATLHRDGWNTFGWPEHVGGRGGDVRHRAVLYDRLVAAGLPVPEAALMLETLGPALLRFAPGLAAEFLPAYLSGTEWWGQGFSEPEAGSDLASLRCRARLDGEHYVVSGQKLWTSHGATAARFVCLVRTGSPDSRHRGLSMLMIDRDAPGVEVRPVAIASGRNELAEVFFDDVRVHRNRLIGDHDGGWAVAMYLMQFERSVYAWQCAAVALARINDLARRAARLAELGPLPDGTTRRLGEVYADVVTMRARSAATIRSLAAGTSVGPEASVDKVLLATVETGLYDLARDLLNDDFVLGDRDEDAAWREEWWYSRSATILGGSAEVQRTIIADHILRLPREGAA